MLKGGSKVGIIRDHPEVWYHKNSTLLIDSIQSFTCNISPNIYGYNYTNDLFLSYSAAFRIATGKYLLQAQRDHRYNNIT